MAGTVQTGTLVGGQWMTTSVDVRTVLERHQERKQEGHETENEPVPHYGLLTQTVIGSSAVRWIFPAQIRSPEYRDVAFIGDHFIQIRQLDGYGHFHDVARKTIFGQRICNACIVGARSLGFGATGDSVLSRVMREADGDVSMQEVSESELIPPQFILLAVESGDLMFLSARNVGRHVEFITSHYKVMHRGAIEPPGIHLKVDPSSRYVAVAASEIDFVIYSLKPRKELNMQAMHGEPCHHIASEHHLHVRGVILKMEFLFPAADDPDHIILLLLVVRNGSTAMFIYEWEAGQSLTDIRTNNLRGLALPLKCRMPLFLIPLTIMSAVLFVSADSIVECHSLLEGSPVFQNFSHEEFPASPNYLGHGLPLWTAWARPYRHSRYSKTHDVVYVAREDGVIVFLELVPGPSEILLTMISAGNFNSGIGTAFTNFDLAPDGMDFLIGGSDSGDGGSYLVAAKNWAQLVETIPNWAPTIDFITTARNVDPGLVPQDYSQLPKKRRLVFDDSDRLFACTGRGSQGAVSEIRYGYEAKVKLDIDGINYTVNETWALPVSALATESRGSEVHLPSLFLLSIGDESILLHLTEDFGDIEEISQSSTWLDLGSRTLAATSCNGLVIQVTERSISISAEPLIMQVEGVQTAIYQKQYPISEKIVAAAILENELLLVVTRGSNGDLQVSVLRVYNHHYSSNPSEYEMLPPTPSLEVFGSSFPLSRYPSSVSIVRQSDGSTYAVICATDSGYARGSEALKKSSVPLLSALFRIEGTKGLLRIEDAAEFWPLNQASETGVVLEACVGIANLRMPGCEPGQNELLLAGYRSGVLVMVSYTMTSEGILKKRKTTRYPMGSTPVTFKTDPKTPNVALICCDSKLWRLSYDCFSNAHPQLHRVWFTASENASQQQLPVHHVSILPFGLLLYSGNQLLVTSLDPQAKPIPRQMHLGGSPHRLIYSHRFGRIIVGMSQGERLNVKFLNPESGSVTGILSPTPTRLGKYGEKILCLVEWRQKSSWEVVDFLMLGTSEGRLLIYKNVLPDLPPAPPTGDHVSYAAFLEENYDTPVSSIVTCAHSFFFCVGETIRWVTLESSAAKLLTRAEYKLPSRAISMSIDGHWLNVLTVRHSLITLLLVDKRIYPKFADQHGQLTPQFADEIERDGLDQICLTSDFYVGMKKDCSIIMVGDFDRTVAGLWYSKKAQTLESSHNTLFEADLPCSMVKFRFGRTRPPWDRILMSSTVSSAHSAVELLGMGIDGSITQFSILEDPVCKLFRFLQQLAQQSDGTQSMSHMWNQTQIGKKVHPREKHIDGEVLRPYLSHGMLERLLMCDESHMELSKQNLVIEEFCTLVSGLHLTDKDSAETLAEMSLEECIDETYRLLADLLRPVL